MSSVAAHASVPLPTAETVHWRPLPEGRAVEREARAADVGAWRRWRRSGLFWLLHTAYWLVVWAACHLLVEIFAPSIADPEAFIASRVALGFVATAGLHWLAMRPDLLRQLGVTKLGAIVGGTITVAVAASILQDRLWLEFDAGAVASRPRWLVAMFIVRFAMLAGWAIAYVAASFFLDANRERERALKAESAARLAELRLLHSQMNPHFLFNALNAVLSSRDDPQAVERVTLGLSEYLRSSLRATRPLEPLGRELDAIEGYLTVEEARFGDRLACSIDCERSARGVPVPPTLVQPLVENAIKYGSAADGEPLRIAVRATVADGRLVVEVANTGRWEAAADPARSHGIGLHALKRQLAILFEGAADVAVAEADGWVRVRVTVPIAAEGGA